MRTVQLIERVELTSSLWLTFWDFERHRQVSLEVAGPSFDYRVGQLYKLDSRAKQEREALRPVMDDEGIAGLDLIVPLRPHQPDIVSPALGASASSVEAAPARIRTQGTLRLVS